MIIHLKCKNGHELKVAEYLMRENPENYTHCICGAKFSVVNVNEVAMADFSEQIKYNVSAYFKTEGIEGTLEMIERTKPSLPEKIYEAYRKELALRGLKIK